MINLKTATELEKTRFYLKCANEVIDQQWQQSKLQHQGWKELFSEKCALDAKYSSALNEIERQKILLDSLCKIMSQCPVPIATEAAFEWRSQVGKALVEKNQIKEWKPPTFWWEHDGARY